MVQVNILEARNRFSQLVKAVESGEEIVISKRGVPVARLVGIEPSEPKRGNGRAIVEWLEKHPLPDHMYRTAEEIDRAIEEERNAWE